VQLAARDERRGEQPASGNRANRQAPSERSKAATAQ